MKHLLTLMVGIFIGLVFGFYKAPLEFKYYDAQYQASISASQLKFLESGNFENLEVMFETDLDQGLSNHARYLESPYSWLFFYLPNKDTEAIERAANYRKTNPYSPIDLSSSASWGDGVDMNEKFIQSVIARQKEDARLKAQVLILYAN